MKISTSKCYLLVGNLQICVKTLKMQDHKIDENIAFVKQSIHQGKVSNKGQASLHFSSSEK